MISQKLQDLINIQIQNELYSAYLYWSMAAYCEEKNLKGFANWYRIQTQEERDHALMFYNYLNLVDAHVTLLPIAQPDADFSSPMDVLKRTLEHEKKVTGMIYNLMDAAQDERDYKTIQFLQWFVSEQAEEENNARDNINRLALLGEQSEQGLFMMDEQMAARIYVPSANLTQE